MVRDIITHESERSKKLNELLQGLHNLYKQDVENAIALCYELGATQDQIAKALGSPRSTIAIKYPKKGKKNGK